MSRSGNQVSEYISNTFLGKHCSRRTSKRNCKVSRHRGLGRLPPACAKHQINSVNLQRRFETSLIWYGYETESPHSHCRDMRGEEGRLPSGGIRSDECRGGAVMTACSATRSRQKLHYSSRGQQCFLGFKSPKAFRDSLPGSLQKQSSTLPLRLPTIQACLQTFIHLNPSCV